jgi:hypothetical protein
MSEGLSKEEYILFRNDAEENSIVVGGHCKNNCIFCSCLAQQKAGRKNWTEYISKDDLLSVIDYINPNKVITFGEGPSFLSCEPFQHPDYLDLLNTLNTYFPNTKKLTTTVGKWIKPEHYEILIKSNIEFIVSANSFIPEERKEIMHSEDDYFGMVNFLKECHSIVKKVSFLHAGNLDNLKRSLEIMYRIHPSYEDKIHMLRMVDHSKFHSKKNEELYMKSYENWHDAVRLFENNTKKAEYWIRSLTDFPEDISDAIYQYPLYRIHSARKMFENTIKEAMKYLHEVLFIDPEQVGWLLPESTYEYFLKVFPEIKNPILVKNNLFGGSYVSAGLLTFNDVMNAVLKNKKLDHYIASIHMFNNKYRDLLGYHGQRDYPFNLILI